MFGEKLKEWPNVNWRLCVLIANGNFSGQGYMILA